MVLATRHRNILLGGSRSEMEELSHRSSPPRLRTLQSITSAHERSIKSITEEVHLDMYLVPSSTKQRLLVSRSANHDIGERT